IPVVLARRPKADVAIQESLAQESLARSRLARRLWIATSPIARLKTGVSRRPKAPRGIDPNAHSKRARSSARTKQAKSPPRLLRRALIVLLSARDRSAGIIENTGSQTCAKTNRTR